MANDKATGKFTPLGPKKAVVPRKLREGDTVPASTVERIAHALEHIAIQMDDINDNIKKLIK
jgi:hypothetical protein